MELKDIKELMALLDKSGLAELEFDNGETRLYLSKAHQQMPAQAVQTVISSAPAAAQTSGGVPSVTAAAPAAESGEKITSPMIGTYYSAPAPGSEPFVKAGDIVDKGQTLCIIEAMKIMNTIEADYRCKILRIYTENGAPVEYGQAIFLVEPI